MKNFNDVKNILCNLGMLQGIDLKDDSVTWEYDNDGLLVWRAFYSDEDDWDNEIQAEISNFFKNMNLYKESIENNDINQASNSLQNARISIQSLATIFDSIDHDMHQLLIGKYKTTDLSWPKFDD